MPGRGPQEEEVVQVRGAGLKKSREKEKNAGNNEGWAHFGGSKLWADVSWRRGKGKWDGPEERPRPPGCRQGKGQI